MTIDIDSNLDNADWTKGRAWDVRTADGEVVRTVAQLRSVFPYQSDAELKGMLKLPSAQNMPAALKTELTLLKEND